MHPKHPLFARILEINIPKLIQKPLKLGECNGKGDPDEHIQLVNDRLNYYSADEAFKFKLLALTLVGSARLWSNNLPDDCIESWMDFCIQLTAYSTTQKTQ